jgi:hypothetical protein
VIVFAVSVNRLSRQIIRVNLISLRSLNLQEKNLHNQVIGQIEQILTQEWRKIYLRRKQMCLMSMLIKFRDLLNSYLRQDQTKQCKYPQIVRKTNRLNCSRDLDLLKVSRVLMLQIDYSISLRSRLDICVW